MLAGAPDTPLPAHGHPKVGGRIAVGVAALLVTLGVVVSAGSTPREATDAEAASDARTPAVPGGPAAPVESAPETTAPAGTRTVQLDVTMLPPEPEAIPAETAPAAPPAPVGPAAALGCPENSTLVGTLAEATFGHGITPGSAPIVRYAIDYGDGGSFVSDTIDGVFTHTYAFGGTFDINLEVTDANGLTATASCSWTFSLLDQLPDPIG